MNELRTEPSTVLRNCGARHEDRVDVHAVRVQRQVRRLHLLVVDGHEHQVDVGLRPDRVVRQAAAEDGGEDRAVLFHLLDERVERGGELLLDRSGAMRRTRVYPKLARLRFRPREKPTRL